MAQRPNPTRLEETLESWRGVREGLMAEVRLVPADRFDFRPAPGTRSVRELVQHILEFASIMTGELTRPDANLMRAPWPKMIRKYGGSVARAKTKRELLALLASQIEDAERKFREPGELSLLQLMTYFNGRPGTRYEWWHHGIAHEEYHRGQLALYVRMLGLVPALTRLIEGSD
ncbi:MAG: DinB family protein [Candidatus Eiseniibacteriota bacterium]